MALSMSISQLHDFLNAEFPQVADVVSVDALSKEEITVRWRVEAANLRPGGTVSGPTIFSCADVAIYLAILARVGPKALAVTTNASIDFMRKPSAGADLIARARILKLGRVLAVADALIYSDGSDQPVARASMTYSLPPDG